MNRFAILGAGVNGLTVGNILLDKYPDAEVTIYTSKTTGIVSFVASAQFYPMWLGDNLPADYDKTLRGWFMASKEQFNSRVGASYGISKIVNYELLESEEKPPTYFYDVLSNLQHQSDVALPAPYTHRLSFETMIIDTSIYIPALLADFQQKGGMLVQKIISSISDIEALSEEVIFNCLGLGSKDIFPDDLLKPVKGVALLLKPLAEVKSIISAGDFILAPRGHDLYLGASYNESYTSDDVSQEEIDYIFDNVKKVMETPKNPFSLPEGLLSRDNITETIVGFRPVRSIGPRVEKELVGTKTIIHNYGHGGNGIILSWGTSFSAVELLY